jgi:tRNA(Ser,Leu) C12 N-acetylase TAN1
MAEPSKEVRKQELYLKIARLRDEIDAKHDEIKAAIKELSMIAPLAAADYSFGLR